MICRRRQQNAACCYARGDKGWVTDPSGLSWETFHTFGERTVYGADVEPRGSIATDSKAACGTPKVAPIAAPIAPACCGASKSV